MIPFPMLFGYIIFVVLPRKCTISIIFLTKISIHSGSSGLVGRLFRLWLSNREPVPRARSRRDRCRYRYVCRPGGLPAANGCRLKRNGFGFRGRSCLNHAGMTFLKLLHFSDNLDVSLDIYPNCGLTR